jgi:hypothetical protein
MRGVGERVDEGLGFTGRRFVDAGGELVFSSSNSIHTPT